MPSDLLKKWAESADILLAADSGADRLLEAGFVPNIVVGDLDSISPEGLACGAEVYGFEDQSCTDCDKLLHFASTRGLTPLTLAGIEGDRLDHVLGTIHSVVLSDIREEITLALRRGLSWVLGPGSHFVDVSAERNVSLIPLVQCRGVTTTGLQWPLEDATLEAGILSSISNFSLQGGINVSLDSGLLMLVAEFYEEEFPRW